VVDYFKALTSKTGLPYQKLIDLCLLECAKKRKKTDDAMGGVTTSQSCLFPPRGLRKSREGNAKARRGRWGSNCTSLEQVPNCQRRSTTALIPIGVKRCHRAAGKAPVSMRRNAASLQKPSAIAGETGHCFPSSPAWGGRTAPVKSKRPVRQESGGFAPAIAN
jgi:hypothetical protein